MHEIITLIAEYFIVLSIIGTGLVWLKLTNEDKKRFIVLVIGGAIITLLLAKIGSKIFYNPRPFVVGHFTPYFQHGNDNGFPSDHTLLSSFLAFAALKYSKKTGYALLVIAILIGLSRVIAGVHHLIDIIGSILFALLGCTLAYYLIERFWPKQPAHPEHRRSTSSHSA